METEERYELIEKYLDGKLTGKELLDFENQLKQDPKLSQEVALHRELAEALKEKDVMAFSDLLEQVDARIGIDEQKKEEAKKSRPLFGGQRLIALAAVIVLLLAVGVFWNQLLPPPSNQELFAQNYELHDMRLLTRGSAEDALMARADSAYKAGAYQEAIAALQQLEAARPGQPRFTFYKGMSQLADGQTQAAITTFGQVMQGDAPEYKELARWYRALSYLKINKEDQAMEDLQQMLDTPSHYRQQEAQAIVKALKKRGRSIGR
jgi:hypothetical protein